MKIQPLFIMGSARSGTTWLANLLSDHPSIASLTCDEHHGIHESHLYDHTRYCFDELVVCKDFVSKYKNEDYYKLLNLAEDDLCHNCNEKNTVFYWFRMLMDKYAKNDGARYWLEKTPKHTIYYDEIICHYPDAMFILIDREFRQTLLSNLTKYARNDANKYIQIAEKVFRYELDQRALRRIEHSSIPNIRVHYEDLFDNADKIIEKIEIFLNIERKKLINAYKADSSYKNSKSRYSMSMLDLTFAYIFRMVTKIAPYSLSTKIRKERDKKTKIKFPLFNRIK